VKTIAPAAMAAIEAGEAIVTGAVEIIPRIPTVSILDLSAAGNAAHDTAGGLANGITLTGFDPADVINVSLPPGQTYSAYCYDGHPNIIVGDGNSGSATEFRVIRDGGALSTLIIGDGFYPTLDNSAMHDGFEAARAAFVPTTITGASSYTFYIFDNIPVIDNLGGLSIKLEIAGEPVLVPDSLRVWGGYGPIEIGGNAFAGVGNSAIVQQTSGAIGGVAQGLTIGLSGIDPAALELLDDAAVYQGASVVIYRLIFASDGKTLLDAHVFDRGRLDGISSEEVIGAAAAITAAVESAARGLGRSGARMRSDSDQRLIDPSDGYFKSTAYAGEKMLYWGGKRPVRTGEGGGGLFGGALSSAVNG
jgi:hypothetical protein